MPSFLTAQVLEAKRKEAQEEDAAKIKAELHVLMSIPQADCTAEQWQRKLELNHSGHVLL